MPEHSPDPALSTFFFGFGYSARAAARALRKLVDPRMQISGTSRSAELSDDLLSASVNALTFDGTAPTRPVSEALASANFVISSIAPDASGDPVLAHHRSDLDNDRALEWMCYYSTVGVYGNFDGAWIDESAPCHPLNKRSAQRLEAENAWRDYAKIRGVPLLILRLAGIYGPGRSAFDKLREGTARRIVKKGQVFNRIHVEDIGRVTALAMKNRLSGTFNLADNEPAPPQNLVSHAANLIGVPPPPEIPFEEAEMTEMARSFYGDNKRVSSRAILDALSIELLHPTYREGLQAIVSAEAG